jgi:hypothetical protein
MAKAKAAFKAFSKAMTSPRSFLKIATSKCDAMTPFGHTRSIRTPERWATQMLGLNFVTSSARFLLRAVASMIPAPSTTARATPKFPPPPLGAKLAYFRIRRVLRADDPPSMTPGRYPTCLTAHRILLNSAKHFYQGGHTFGNLLTFSEPASESDKESK